MSTISGRTATVTTFNSQTSASVLAPTQRTMWFVFNNSGQTLYLLFGTGTASTTNFSVSVPTGGYYECPAPAYTGQINGILGGAPTDSVKVTSW